METYQNLNSNSTELSSNLACKKRNIYSVDEKFVSNFEKKRKVSFKSMKKKAKIRQNL